MATVEKETAFLYTMHYNIWTKDGRDKKTELNWILRVLKTPMIEIDNICISETFRRKDGLADIDRLMMLPTEISVQNLFRRYLGKNIDGISITAVYQDCPVTIGIKDLQKGYAIPFMTITTDGKTDYRKLEDYLFFSPSEEVC